MINMDELTYREARAITDVFRAHGIKAKADPVDVINIAVGFIRYPLIVAPSEKYSKIEAVHRELSGACEQVRVAFGLSNPVPVLPSSTFGGMSLEVPHPAPKPLLWSPRKVLTSKANTMLLGKSYLAGPRLETVSLEDTPHVLIAGITGAGKSVLLQTMLLSLAASTSPDELQFVMVDLKNEDLVPFRVLPHVRMFAARRAEASDAIKFVYDEKEKRVEQYQHKPYRLVLVVDEMAQIASDKEISDMLGDLASIGRSKNINLIGATQHPTDKGGLGSMLKANFPIRLVGMVAPGQSYIATGRAELHADLLPGKGAFLRIEGPNVYRLQSYFIEPADVAGMAKYIAEEVWGCARVPDMTGYGGDYQADMQPAIASYSRLSGNYHPSEKGHGAVVSYEKLFPVNEGRALTTKEAAAVRTLADAGEFDYRGKFSMNRAMMHVYGSRNPDRAAWIDEALEGADDAKIISLKRKVG